MPRLPDHSGEVGASDGLSLDAMREIAKEVGLEQRFVDQAAASLLLDPAAQGSGLLGGPSSHHVSATFARTLTASQRIELLDVIRGVLSHEGALNDVMGSIEWRTVGLMSQTTVTITPDEDSVSVRVFNDRGGLAVLTWTAPVLVGLVTAFATLNAINPTAGGGVWLSMLAGGVVVGAGVARQIWSATTRSARARTERLREAIALYLNG
ncbi:MAG TPA: hypothetical protein EYQ27_19445 [Gemmatimonadetes bacterium]|nr:hypothetical protein [Gemmatimonadota bacterium]